MAVMKLLPISSTDLSVNKWVDLPKCYDNNTTTYGTVRITSSTVYSADFIFDTTVINGNIQSIDIIVCAKCDILTDMSVIPSVDNEGLLSIPLNSTQNSYTKNYVTSKKGTIKINLEPTTTETLSKTFYLYEVYLNVNYTESTSKKINKGALIVDKLCIGNTQVSKVYLGTNLIYG